MPLSKSASAIVLEVKLALSLMIFLSNFAKLFDEVQIFQPAFTVILGDFNAWSKSWWSGESTTIESTRLNSLVSTYAFHQLISKPTHILRNLLSCIDPIFTD